MDFFCLLPSENGITNHVIQVKDARKYEVGRVLVPTTWCIRKGAYRGFLTLEFPDENQERDAIPTVSLVEMLLHRFFQASPHLSPFLSALPPLGHFPDINSETFKQQWLPVIRGFMPLFPDTVDITFGLSQIFEKNEPLLREWGIEEHYLNVLLHSELLNPKLIAQMIRQKQDLKDLIPLGFIEESKDADYFDYHPVEGIFTWRRGGSSVEIFHQKAGQPNLVLYTASEFHCGSFEIFVLPYGYSFPEHGDHERPHEMDLF